MPALDPQLQRQFAIEVVQKLREAIFEAYWAGGCVRDQLLGKTPKDYDVATDATPEETREVFGKHRTLSVGAAFGVIVVLGPPGAGQIDVATFREDLGYSDGRRPDGVVFATPELDALRRDFTINGLFYDPVRQQVIDYVEGQADLAAGIVRAIGEPRERIAEDKLRMLRAVRFAASLDFQLDGQTAAAIGELAGGIQAVSAERIAAEMTRILTDGHRARGMRLLAETNLLPQLLPELPPLDTNALSSVWSQTLTALARLEQPAFPLALATLLAGLEQGSATVMSLAGRWKLSNRDAERAAWLLEHSQALVGARGQSWPRVQRLLAHEAAEDLVQLHEALSPVTDESPDDVAWCRQTLAMPRQQWDPPALITGNDLLALGIPAGKVYHYLLEQARDAQLEGRVTTADQAKHFVRALYESAENPP